MRCWKIGKIVLFLLPALYAQARVVEIEPNQGQADSTALFLTRVSNLRVLIGDRGFEFRGPDGPIVKLSWLDSEYAGEWVQDEPTGNTTHYCNQPGARLCQKGVPGYARLTRHQLYGGIDWVIYARQGELEYDLILHPHTDPKRLRFRVEGATAHLDERGQLHAGPLLQRPPQAYQWLDGSKVAVDVSLRRNGSREFVFDLGAYRRDLPLTIDPVIQGVAVVGGVEADRIVGTAGWYRYGTTRSADWTGMPNHGTDVWVQFETPSFGTRTVFWGGSGDEEIGGSDFEANNNLLYLAGWTNSRDAARVSPSFESAGGYAGGSTDGYILRFQYGTLSFAGHFGGAGTDRLRDVRRLGPVGSSSGLILAGETDDPNWTGSRVERVGPGGRTDAIVGVLDPGLGSLRLVAIGGSGDDRAIRVRAVDKESWVVAGETNSADFAPALEGQPVGGRDLWIGRLQLDPVAVGGAVRFGGSGDDRLGGLAAIPGEGLYLAGTTTSPDLPVSQSAYKGGESDAFLAHLHPTTVVPILTTYLGGVGRDEITALESRDGDLYAGGSTDSDDLSLPGLAPGDSVAGGADGLFVYCDAFGVPMLGIRTGGPGDDRVMSVEPGELGKVTLAGASHSRDWLRQLDPFHPVGDDENGFVLRASFPAIRVMMSTLYLPVATVALDLGRDLQAMLSIVTAADAGMDGVVLARILDPAKVLISARYDRPGSDAILLANSVQYSVTLQGLAPEGETDVVLSSRSAQSAAGHYPQRRLRVRSTPAGLFFNSLNEVRGPMGSTVDVGVYSAPLLPSGKAGPEQSARAGVVPVVSLLSSDPDVAAALQNSNTATGTGGQFRVRLRLDREGVSSVTPISSNGAAGPGQTIVVRSMRTAVTGFQFGSQQLAKDHMTTFQVSGLAGDSLRVTSEDPARLAVSQDQASWASSTAIQFGAATFRTLYVTALADNGTAGIRVEGTLQGQPFSERIEIRLFPYRVNASFFPSNPGVGATVSVDFLLSPVSGPNGGFSGMTLRPGALQDLRIVNSNPAVLELISGQPSSQLQFRFTARRPGTAVVEVAPGSPTEFAGLQVSVEVVPAMVGFGLSEILVPAGTKVSLQPTSNASAFATQRVRVRLSQGAPFTIVAYGGSGTDVTVDFRQFYAVDLVGENAQPGQTATMYVSAPGIAEYAIPIRVVEAVVVPTHTELRVRTGASQHDYKLFFTIYGYENGRVIPLPYPASFRRAFAIPIRVTPSEICAVPNQIEAVYVVSSGIPVACPGAGETVISLGPVAGLGGAQAQFTTRILSQPAAPPPLLPFSSILTGHGLQTGIYLGEFKGTLTSLDPERVRLSLQPLVAGTATVTLLGPGSVYVQGSGSESIVTLRAENSDGRNENIAVYVLPSTMALRPGPGEAATLSANRALSERDLSLHAAPYLVDTATGKLIAVPGLAIRGGTDPLFLNGSSSDDRIVEAVSPSLVSEGDQSAQVRFRLNAAGEAVLRVSQPAGFVSPPDAGLRVRVFEPELTFSTTPVVCPDLQVAVIVSPLLSTAGSPVPVTVTSLDPEKLVVSGNRAEPGRTTFIGQIGQVVYLQALNTAAPGEKVRVRLEAPGYAVSEREVLVARAELRLQTPQRRVELQPGSSAALNLQFGPVVRDEDGREITQYPEGPRPGARFEIRVSSSDPSIFEVVNPVVALSQSYASVPVQTFKPGTAELRVEAPAEVLNHVERVEAVVVRFRFQHPAAERAAAYLTSRLTVRNPRNQPTALTLTSTGSQQVRLGTAQSGPGAPASAPVTVTLNASEERTFFIEPSSGSGSTTVRLSAPEFDDYDAFLSVTNPQVGFNPPGPLSTNLTGAPVTVAVVLTVDGREYPLGTAFGPLRVQVTSSNPQVVRPPAAPLEILPGQSRATLTLQAVGRGDAAIALGLPPGFNGTVVRQNLLVTIR